MPTYLCHGFRWHRREIRIFVIVNNLDDATPDWIIGRTSSAHIIAQLASKFDFVPWVANGKGVVEPKNVDGAKADQQQAPGGGGPVETKVHQDDDFSVPASRVPAWEDDVLVNASSPVKLLEEYDSGEMLMAARPYAYVADYAVRIDLSADVAGEMAKYEAQKGDASWLAKLRDGLQADEEIRWYVVVCADEERAAPPIDDDDDDDDDDDYSYSDGKNSTIKANQEELIYSDESDDQGPPPPTKDFPPRQNLEQQQKKSNGLLREAHASPYTTPRQAGQASLPVITKPLPPPQPQRPVFLGDDPFKTSPPVGLRNKLSAKGLRRLFSKKEDVK
ncbi:hypothetical protein CDD81_4192 [Ophiocordyceps australis]|uniref:Uncharacterized protein n=1 Tax=Ophiocordyceps australis TaxID=1399860 RepID=A0A2C5YCH9_9HYPO|nr:hypothetical protein CDD81_4192 [Ophiocordyceps australis]